MNTDGSVRNYPLHPEEVTNEFLSSCLGSEITSFGLDTSMTDGGVLADAFRVKDIEYKNPVEALDKNLPKSCFIKCTKEIPEIVEMCLSTQVYAKEVYFYSTLINTVKEVIRVPDCYGIFKDENDLDCREFCLVLEDFSEDEWVPFDQFENPMNFDDTEQFMKDLASFHAACWGEPVSDQPGLGPFKAHWQSLNDEYWSEDGTTTWDDVLPKWEEIYEEPMLTMVDEEVRSTIERITEIYASKNGKKIQEALIESLKNTPRTITHGDARGNNIFKSKKNGTMGVIDWQMWVAGPASNEFGQVWFNSYSLESGMIHRFEELTKTYYESLCSHKSEIREEYPFDQMMIDIKLLFINIWIEYLGFTVGSLDGYKDPAQQKAKDNWKEMITRNMQTIHYSGCLETFEDFIAGLNLD